MKYLLNFTWASLCLICFAILISFAHADDDDDEEKQNNNLIVKEAKWDDEKSRLKLAGKGRTDSNIIFYDAQSMQHLGGVLVEDGEWEVKISHLASSPCQVKAVQSGGQTVIKVVEEASSHCSISGPSTPSDSFAILAVNDLGMHCADQDYRIFSILPPYNVLNAQVIQKGNTPKLVSPADGVRLTYKAAYSNFFSDLTDPNKLPDGTDSITRTSQNQPSVFKTNFWDSTTASASGLDKIGFIAYELLYPPQLLALFPSTPDLGLAYAELYALYYGPDGILNSGDEVVEGHQSAMPGLQNMPRPFNAYIQDLPFFINFPFGQNIKNFNRYAAEGIPITPIDDMGNLNPYPLMTVEARDANNNIIASVDTVVPVASEADCAICHASQDVCSINPQSLTCDDIAHANYSAVDFIETSTQALGIIGATSEQKVINSAKTNILRLHDYKHNTSLAGVNEDGSNGNSTPNVVCANCHYSPALDLAHLGPNDSNGKQQTQHISMSRAMHGVHGSLPNRHPLYAELFPIMPPPGAERDPQLAENILMQTCYNCHPGKKTKCLRGAMGGSGTVCQDCHGQLSQVGDDFSEDFPYDNFRIEKDTNGEIIKVHGADLNKRVPWASEPSCDSCHVGDVLQVAQLKQKGSLNDVITNSSDSKGNQDNLRLSMAYRLSDHKSNGGPNNLPLLKFPNSRFASNESLYRLSGGDNGNDKGHGGLSCEGCHGSTHAIWPNANPYANDNKLAKDLQGHSGTIIECSTCHEGNLGNTLAGPHGMHPVGNTSFSDGGHEDMAEDNKNACRACHGLNGEGTVLSRVAADRVLSNEDKTVYLKKGEVVSCSLCHDNEL